MPEDGQYAGTCSMHWQTNDICCGWRQHVCELHYGMKRINDLTVWWLGINISAERSASIFWVEVNQNAIKS